MTEKTFLLGVDTGGTFTDLCLVDPDGIRIHKVLSTPESPEKAILKGLDELGLKNKKENLYIVHGTTVATNAALENKGVKTAFITNKGFADILSIGRQARKELYNLRPQISQPPVATKLCLETAGRISAKGEVLHPLTEQDLDRLEQQIIALKPKAIAINLLFSFLNDKAEKRIEARLSQYAFTTRSSYILPEIREYERGIVTWYNAYLGPLIEDYLKRLKQAVSPAPVAIMQSSGGTIDIDQAAQKAVNLLLSGPAGGLAAGAYIGKLAKAEKILSFDMGGTSTDVALIEKEIKLTSEARIGHYPISIPMVDMHTIGAGGGSIAFQDAAGMLRVGPESAGAAPGPVCYGLGGQQPTVTDANAVLGRLQPDNFLGGTMSLDLNAARSSIGRLAKKLSLSTEECAAGIIELANEHMARALRVISEQRGHNPEEYQLMGFGGAGGLHICALAHAIGCKKAIVPIFSGVLSAFGMLVAPKSRNLSRTYPAVITQLDSKEVTALLTQMEKQAIDSLILEGASKSDIHIEKSLDCRYQGQSFTLDVPWADTDKMTSTFHQRHKQTYGHTFEIKIEVVNLRLSAKVHQQSNWLDLLTGNTNNAISTNKTHHTGQQSLSNGAKKRSAWVRNQQRSMEAIEVIIIQRENLTSAQNYLGPMLICEQGATIWVESGWQVTSDDYGNLLLEPSGQ